MFQNRSILILFTTLLGLYTYQCLKFVPERCEVLYVDDNYFKNVSLNVRRSRRGGDYVVNLYFTNLHYAGNNMSISGIFFEYLNNEYKPSFIELHYKFCDLLLKDRIFGEIPRHVGLTTCPMPPGTYALQNISFNQEIPSIWPFHKGKLQVIFKHDTKPNGVIAKGEVMLSFENNVASIKKRN